MAIDAQQHIVAIAIKLCIFLFTIVLSGKFNCLTFCAKTKRRIREMFVLAVLYTLASDTLRGTFGKFRKILRKIALTFDWCIRSVFVWNVCFRWLKILDYVGCRSDIIFGYWIFQLYKTYQVYRNFCIIVVMKLFDLL